MLLFASLLLLQGTPVPSPLQVEQVLDINTEAPGPGQGDSYPSLFTAFDAGLLFRASGADLGFALRYKAIGEDSIQLTPPSIGNPSQIATLPGPRAVFSAKSSSDQKRYVHVTDGTLPGTFTLLDPTTGEDLRLTSGPVQAGGVAWFGRDAGDNTYEIWSSDGTPSGTRREFGVDPGPSTSQVVNYTPAGDGLFLAGWSAGEPTLTRVGQPGEAPVQLGSLSAVDSEPELIREAIEFQGALWFAAAGPGGEGVELYRSDGTAEGTGVFLDVQPGAGGSWPRFVAASASELYFFARPEPQTIELWVTDGSVSGTRAVLEILPGNSDPLGVVLPDGRLLFNSVGSLSITDGTAAGTQLLLDFSLLGPHTECHAIEVVGDRVFAALGTGLPALLYVSDGTPSGTESLGFLSSTNSFASPFGAAAGRMFFARNEIAQGGIELWSSGGTVATTQFEEEISADPETLDSDPADALRLGDRVLFVATGSDTLGAGEGRELWITDATALGTQRVVDLWPGPSGSDPDLMAEIGGRALFVAREPVHGRELWATDGTEIGTELLVEFNPGPSGSVPRNFVRVGDQYLFLVQEDGSLYTNLWRTDGSTSGTFRLTEDVLIQSSTLPDWAASTGTRLIFAATSSEGGREPWVSDGTPAGTGPLADLVPGPVASNPGSFASFRDEVYFNAWTPELGRELWATDGTATGTRLVLDLEPGITGGWPGRLQASAERLMFVAPTLSYPQRIWVSDGTAAGTQALVDLEPTFPDFKPEVLQPVGGRVVFVRAVNPDSGFWITDGVAGNLHEVLVPGAADFMAFTELPFALAGGSDGLLFTASVDEGGEELWFWDGPGSTPQWLADISAGYASATPEILLEFGGDVLLAANEPATGRELYRFSLADLDLFGAEPFGTGCGSSATALVGHAGSATPGGLLEVTLTAAPPLAPAFGYYDAGVDLLPLSTTCISYLADPKLLGATTTDVAGHASFPATLPDSTALAGLAFAVQVLVSEPGGPLLGAFGLSAGIEFVIGT